VELSAVLDKAKARKARKARNARKGEAKGGNVKGGADYCIL
jgi:hypothetical protein